MAVLYETGERGMNVAGTQGVVRQAHGGDGEQILEVFYGLLASSFGSTVIYDLVITDRRLVGILTETVTGGLAAAVVGEIEFRKAKNRRRDYQPADLDRYVALSPRSFAVPHAAVEEAKVKGILEKAIQIRSGRVRVYLYVPKSDLPRLTAILARTVPHATG